MAIKTLKIGFDVFFQESLVRTNFKTAHYGRIINHTLGNSTLRFERIKEKFTILSGFAFKSSDYLVEGIPLIRIADVGNDFGEKNMVFLPEDYKEEYGKVLLKKKDIIVSLTGDGKLKCDIILETDKYLLNQRVGALRLRTTNNILFYYYILKYYSLIAKQFYWLSNGKTQLNISPFDFVKIKIPIVQDDIQRKVISHVQPIEKKIYNYRQQILPTQQIIDKIFVEAFKWDLDKFQELTNIKKYHLEFASFSNNIDLRNSVKFHREAGSNVISQLKSVPHKKIKKFLSEPIVLGKSISPAEFDDKGETFYISMANIKSWKFEELDAKTVSKKYAESNSNKRVMLDDILIARSGEGTIGKIALIDNENVDGIFADFTMRIRLKDYNVLFAYYYFRSSLFQYLIEINKKGLGNNTNIFPSQIKEFPMIDISLEAQGIIVKKVKIELDKQDIIKGKILTEKRKIDNIIDECIRN